MEPEVIESGLTDEQLLAFIEASNKRRIAESDSELDRITIGVNTGYLITHDRTALRRWQARRRASAGRPPQTPDEFRANVARIAAMFPTKVTIQ